MAIIKVKATSPGRRGLEKVVTPGLHKGKPFSPLLQKKIRGSGRNSSGRITVRHQGGGHKQFIRLIDFKRNKDGIPAKVETIEYDPNRTSHIALIKYDDDIYSYIICPQNLKVGDKVISSDKAEIKVGNCMQLKNIPTDTLIHNIEMKPGKGAQLNRSAGTYSQLIGKDAEYAQIKLSSGEIRVVRIECRATIGMVSNADNKNIKLGKRNFGKVSVISGLDQGDTVIIEGVSKVRNKAKVKIINQ